VLAEKEMTLANSKDTPKRIEARFKKEERGREGIQKAYRRCWNMRLKGALFVRKRLA
jgi:hypothetical protein